MVPTISDARRTYAFRQILTNFTCFSEHSLLLNPGPPLTPHICPLQYVTRGDSEITTYITTSAVRVTAMLLTYKLIGFLSFIFVWQVKRLAETPLKSRPAIDFLSNTTDAATTSLKSDQRPLPNLNPREDSAASSAADSNVVYVTVTSVTYAPAVFSAPPPTTIDGTCQPQGCWAKASVCSIPNL